MADDAERLTLESLALCVQRMAAWENAAGDQLRALMREQGQRCWARLMATAPVRTGFMRDNTRLVYGDDGYAWSAGWFPEDFTGAGFAFYPFFLEYGTRYMAPRPTVGPVREELLPTFLDEIVQLLNTLDVR
jgi:hypothetical protein